ncbi:hypothetical protein [Pseudomonas sp. 51_B]|uniref:hypothetical protein n=1 Tax=Pseudomonas sp. 51_B TaxID=2813573 RepID=UPI001A9E2038|nr:hypothetical protein [Pseudomonas sp. 51_B]
MTVGMIQGFAASDWINARETARSLLIQRVRKPDPFIFYSDLVTQLPLAIEASDPRLSVLLDEISSSEHELGRGFLTVLVVRKGRTRIPGPGFFEMARKHGFEFLDDELFFLQEYRRLIEYWRGQP